MAIGETNVMSGRGGSSGFTGFGNVTINGGTSSRAIAYMNENMELVSNQFNLPIPVPQIIYISAIGRQEGMNLTGDYTPIRETSYPAGRVIYMYGDITVTSL